MESFDLWMGRKLSGWNFDNCFWRIEKYLIRSKFWAFPGHGFSKRECVQTFFKCLICFVVNQNATKRKQIQQKSHHAYASVDTVRLELHQLSCFILQENHALACLNTELNHVRLYIIQRYFSCHYKTREFVPKITNTLALRCCCSFVYRRCEIGHETRSASLKPIYPRIRHDDKAHTVKTKTKMADQNER